jgi:hypothetical protein
VQGREKSDTMVLSMAVCRSLNDCETNDGSD